MTLTIYGHPLSSYTQKVLVAAYDIAAPFTFHQIDLSKADDRALMGTIDPMGRMPGLRDDARNVTLSQSSVMIEYLDRHHGQGRLLPVDPDAALVARQWDRFFDFQIMQMMQQIVDARLFMGEAAEEPVGNFARGKLELAYAALDRHLDDGREWITGDFGLSDCAAAPSLFYAGILHPFADFPALSAYFERVLARPSFHRARTEALPWLQYFPFQDLVPDRFRA